METRNRTYGIGLVALACLFHSLLSSAVLAQGAAPQAQELGTVSGVVTDAANGDTIIDAGVEVIGQSKKVRTGVDGDFTLKLAPGTYQLRIFAPLYDGARLQNVVVEANKTVKVTASLKPQGESAMETVEVVAAASKAAEATQLMKRRESNVVQDNVGAQTIQKSPDSDAAEVVTRMPAVTIKDDKFIYVRGLGERYSSALLDGNRLPSTDPNKRVVPLDLFPAEFLESLSIVKSYTPDLPGDFAGGLANINLKDHPEEFHYSIGITSGINTNATFQGTRTYEGSDVDWLGFGADHREAPDGIPGRIEINQSSPAQNRVYGKAFKNIWNTQSTSAPPNMGVNFSIGNKVGPVGGFLGVSYNNEYKQRHNEVANVINQGDSSIPGQGDSEPILQDQFTGERSTFETRLGAVLTSGYQYDANHRFSLRGLLNRNTTDDVVTRVGSSRNPDPKDTISSQSFRYVEDQLGYVQVGGQHHFSWLDVDWRTAGAQTTENEPDRRQLRYISFDGTSTPVLDSSGSKAPLRTFLDLEELMTDNAVDVSIPFLTRLPGTDVWRDLPAKLKVGAAYTLRDRSTDYRRFMFEATRGLSGVDTTKDAESILAEENLGSIFRVREDTRAEDSFTATQEIAGGYAMLELPIIERKLRVVGGGRVEYSYINAGTEGPGGDTLLNDLDFLPGVSLIATPYEPWSLRYGYSKTVSRPEFRELTISAYVVDEGELIRIGNPDLVTATIESHDLRWDWFLSGQELVSLGVFYKELRDPVEETIISGGDKPLLSYRNAPKATLYGGEAEVRKGLASLLSPVSSLAPSLGSTLSNLFFSANVSIIESEVNFGAVDPDAQDIITNRKRALQGQSPFTTNAALEYEIKDRGVARLLYNTAGRRIVAAGFSKVPDVYEERRDQLDFVLTSKIQPFEVPLNLKLAVENILNDDYRRTQGEFLERRYRSGVRFGLGLSYSF